MPQGLMGHFSTGITKNIRFGQCGRMAIDQNEPIAEYKSGTPSVYATNPQIERSVLRLIGRSGQAASSDRGWRLLSFQYRDWNDSDQLREADQTGATISNL